MRLRNIAFSKVNFRFIAIKLGARPLAAVGKSLGEFSADLNRSLGRLAPVSHDERMNRFQ